MTAPAALTTLEPLVAKIGIEGHDLLSINDLTNDQILGLFELGRQLEPWNRSCINLLQGKVLATLFFQPSTRTRLSFETAMHRLGGGGHRRDHAPHLVFRGQRRKSRGHAAGGLEYTNIIVLRHFDDVAAAARSRAARHP